MSDDKKEVLLYAMALAEVFGFDEILADNMPISMHGAVIDSKDEKVIPIIYDNTRADPLVRTDKLEEQWEEDIITTKKEILRYAGIQWRNKRCDTQEWLNLTT